MDTALLRHQQIHAGLSKAARVLLGHQDKLRKVLLYSASSMESGTSKKLLQELMSAAIKPSPVKAMFSREEMEVKYSHPSMT